MKKIYFTASLSGKPVLEKHYEAIVDYLTSWGYQVKADHILRSNAKEVVYGQSGKDAEDNYHQLVKWIEEADVFVAEVSNSSLSVGYEIALAMEISKPVVVFHLKGGRAVILERIKSEKLQIVEYDLNDLEESLKDAIDQAFESVEVRFNFFINPKMLAFLSRAAKQRNISRSELIRELITKEMAKEEE